MRIELLEWDSNFFGKKTGSIVIDDNFEASKIISEAQEQGYELLYVFAKSLRPELSDKGFELVDTKVTFSKKIETVKTPIALVDYKGGATHELINLALESGWKSRFNADEKLNHKYKKLYTQWLTRSLSGEFADAVLVHYLEDELAGLVTTRLLDNKGRVGLFAIAESHRGQGLGKKMLLALEAWYHERGIEISEITTQKDNTVACALYKGVGYQVSGISYVYHLHL